MRLAARLHRHSAAMATRTKQLPPAARPKEQKQRFVDPMAVTWMERYSDQMEKIWSRLPNFLGSAIVTVAVFTLGATLRGEWLVVLVHLIKYFGGLNSETTGENTPISWSWSELTLERLHLKNVEYFLLGAVVISYGMYFGIGGFLHWFWYVRRREQPHEWKCQPEKWLSPELERHEILVGSLSLALTSSLTGFLACYISNGGWSTVYYEFAQHGWAWWALQWPAIFIYQDYATYWLHRIYHTPFLYKHFHKLHHKYKQPTAFSVTAIHPVEIMHIQVTLLLPIFVVPVHFVPFYAIALYTYYHGIIDHSGINFKSFWWQPWQPDAIFHDNHHQYFHVNFGFNIYIWDVLHGTYRRKDRVYNEHVFYGRGVALEEASTEELRADMAERRSENPRAYRSNQREFELRAGDLRAGSAGRTDRAPRSKRRQAAAR